MALVGYFGYVIGHRKSVMRVGAAALGSSVLFFVVTNFTVWAAGTMYPKTIDGLLLCYTAAIPFFHNSLAGNVFYATILFGSYELFGQSVDSRLLKWGRNLGIVRIKGGMQ